MILPNEIPIFLYKPRDTARSKPYFTYWIDEHNIIGKFSAIPNMTERILPISSRYFRILQMYINALCAVRDLYVIENWYTDSFLLQKTITLKVILSDKA